jgi:hypothetical protein
MRVIASGDDSYCLTGPSAQSRKRVKDPLYLRCSLLSDTLDGTKGFTDGNFAIKIRTPQASGQQQQC